MSPKELGNKAEIVIISELIKLGFSVSIPFGQNDPFDIVILTNEGFKSVQIKHAIFKNGCVDADIRHRTGFSKIKYGSYFGKVDFLAVWCETINKCYLLSMDDVGEKYRLILRITQPKNNSCISTIVWAKDYELESKAKTLLP